ncbi:MAG TPA: hypothetical protein PKO43_02825, partial [Bacilli bacterium]|nr:hypothetical protein [Bacilli bacterium]
NYNTCPFSIKQKFFYVITKKGIYSIHTLEELLADILSKKNVYTFKDVKENNDYKLKMMVTKSKRQEM